MAAALRPLLLRDQSSLWIGWNGLQRQLSEQERKQAAWPDRLVPLSLPANKYRAYYERVANGSLWPILHGFQPRSMYAPKDWAHALTVVQLFADKVQEVVQKSDIIWIHDFHLLMLPHFLRLRGIKNRIGFFLHTPFYGYDTFRLLPDACAMLRSLLTADVCGLQSPRDLANLRICLKQFGLSLADTQTVIDPVGIDYNLFAGASQSSEVKAHAASLKRLQNKRVILSVSRMDYTKGILEQLAAAEQFLRSCDTPSEWLFKLVAAPSRESMAEYRDMRRKVEQTVAGINKRLGNRTWRPIEYEHRDVPFDELAAWYGVADIMLVTPLIDGMNLVAKEFVAVNGNRDGALILSRTAGAAFQMSDAIQVDPANITELVTALTAAAAMPAAERRRRAELLRQGVQKYDAYHWANTFINALLYSK